MLCRNARMKKYKKIKILRRRVFCLIVMLVFFGMIGWYQGYFSPQVEPPSNRLPFAFYLLLCFMGVVMSYFTDKAPNNGIFELPYFNIPENENRNGH